MSSLAGATVLAVEGAVDHCATDYIGGWVMAELDSPAPITIDILYRGAVIGDCQVDCSPGQRSRFRFDLPQFFPRGELNELEVCIRETSQHLAASTGTPAPSRLNSARTFSRFGGTWVDRADWQEELAERRRAGRFSAEVADQIERFATDGFLIIEGAVSPEIVDRLNAEIDDFWRDPPPAS